MQKLLAQSNDALLLSQVHDAVIATDLDGTIRFWNCGAERVYGYTAAEAIGQPVSSLYFSEDFALLQSAVIAPLSDRDLHEVVLRNRRKDGAEIFIDLRVSVVRSPTGEPIGYAGCSNDITARKRAEEALVCSHQDLEKLVAERNRELMAEVEERTRIAAELRSSRERLNHIIENAPGVLYSCLRETFAPTFVSDNIECILGYSKRDFMSAADFWLNAIHPEDRQRVVARAAAQLSENGGFSQEYRVRHRDGSYRWVRDDARLLPALGGEPVEIVGYCRDITESKFAEDARRRQERLELLAQQLLQTQERERRRLSRELHDDLNQRLAALILDISNLETRLPESRKSIRHSLKEIQNRVASICDEVHRMARQLHPATLEQLGLAAALKSDCAALARRTGIEVSFRCRSLPQLSKDVELCLYRVAQECLSNVVRHSGASRAAVTIQGASDGVRLAVQDWGEGFKPSALPRERLGLLNMTERLRLLRGTLTVDSQIGCGTRIEAWIPVAEVGHDEASCSSG